MFFPYSSGKLPDGFEWDKQAETIEIFLRPVGLPMGFKNACAVWTKIARVLTAKWRREGKKLVHLLDDFMFAVDGSKSLAEAKAVRDAVLADIEAVGGQINWKKSILKACKCLQFLGMLVDSLSYCFYVPQKKVMKLKALVNRMVATNSAEELPETTFRKLASVLGKTISMQIAVPSLAMMTFECFALLRPEGEWDNSTKLTKVVVEELLQIMEWIVQFSKVGNPIRRFIGMQEVIVTVDAGSGVGW